MWFFQRNKELLIGVGRRDFELGSAPAFPVVRAEIDLEEWHTTLSLSHSELGDTHLPKRKKKFLNVSLAFTIILSPRVHLGAETDRDMCCVMERRSLWDFDVVKM